jgi:hypothetical protein
VVGAGVEVRLHARGDLVAVAPGDDRVVQAVAAGALEVRLGPSEAFEVPAIRVAGEVEAHVCGRMGADRGAVAARIIH